MKTTGLASTLLLLSATTLFACGNDGEGGGGESAVDAGLAADADTNAPDAATEVFSCQPSPARLVVLGDSITACFGVDGPDAATCGPKIFHETLAADIAPNLLYQNHAVSGAIVTHIPDRQLATVETGAGHALVLIYMGGNDLRDLLLPSVSDAQAEERLVALKVSIREDWETVFTFFDDASSFPDGATILMNNQYNPFDDCTAPPINLSPRKNEMLREYNDFLKTVSDAHDNGFITDQFTPFLGHGHNNADASCPFYTENSENWMKDLIHPNTSGHANLAAQWATMATRMYTDCE